MHQSAVVSIVISALVASASQVTAEPEFVSRIPNGDKVPGIAALGHVDPNGDGALTSFGEAFDEAGYTWTTALCQADSDGDGQTNGQELGDPCCEFNVDSNPTVRWTEGVSHPGDNSSTSDPSLWAAIDCSNVTATAATDSSYEDSSDVEVGSHDHHHGHHHSGSTSASNDDVVASDDDDDGDEATAETPAPTNTAGHDRTLMVGAAVIAVAAAALW